MHLTNYHTHSRFCDGKGEPEDYVKEAISRGFKALGFSSHAPVPFPTTWIMARENLEHYVREINRLKSAYQGQIQIYLGLEIDYIPGTVFPGMSELEPCNLDYTLGSVHFVATAGDNRHLTVDSPGEEFEVLFHREFKSDAPALGSRYFSLMREMLTAHRPDILGHMDIVKLQNNRAFYFKEDDSWYLEEVLSTLDTAAQSGVFIEVNTGGWSRGKVDTTYPGLWILRECRKRNIPLVLNADAHSPTTIDAFFPEAEALMREAGYRERMVLLDGIWQAVGL
ncbi:MAG: histidinol-phosphatase HisJ family protein [Spirochaetales bacterium]|nr:MAG: histidinol-phosphatase HisJ family protein [Spirochaetales bacterium]